MFMVILIVGSAVAKPAGVENPKAPPAGINIQDLFNNLQVCPGGKLVLNVTVVGDQVKQIDSESFGNEEQETEGVCVQDNKKTQLNCVGGTCTQTNLEINQICHEGSNCNQINGDAGNIEDHTSKTSEPQRNNRALNPQTQGPAQPFNPQQPGLAQPFNLHLSGPARPFNPHHPGPAQPFNPQHRGPAPLFNNQAFAQIFAPCFPFCGFQFNG